MDKRQHDRIALEESGWRAELIDQLSGERLGGVVNLSSGGMMLITPNALETETLYQVDCLVTGPDGGSGRFAAGVMVLWRTETSEKHSYWVGLQIIDIDAESRARLLELGAAIAPNG